MSRILHAVKISAWYVRNYLSASWLKTVCILKRDTPHAVIVFGDSIGDNVICTSIFVEWHRRMPGRLWMMSDYRDLFEGHPDVARIIPYDMSLFWSMRRLGWNGVVASYMKSNVQDDVDVPPNEHMITAICRQAGLKGEIGIRSYMWLSEKERLAGRVAPRQIVFQTSGLAAKYPSGNKEWFHDRFQYVADKLSRKYKIIQLGSVKDPLLCGAVDLRGKTSFRESAAILSESVVFIGLAGFLMNLARAVDCRSVIIYGGREDPHITGYTCNENLVANLSCAPCWRRATCECSRRCMSLVTCEMVLDAFGRQVERFGSPLEIATEQIL